MEPVWELFRPGQRDQERHHDKIRKAIEDNLGDLIGDASIMDGTGHVKVPIRELKEHRFRYADDGGEGTGSGRPGTKQGDVVGRRQSPNNGNEPGDGHEEGVYEVWVPADRVVDHVFADLELPNIRPKAKVAIADEEPKFKDIRRKGPMGLLSVRETIKANLKRNAIQGKPGFRNISDDDLRFRAMDVQRAEKDQCVMISIRDRSGSMGEWEREMSRLGAFWTLAFLRRRYGQQVATEFIIHDTEAEAVDEERFIHESSAGGTRISSAYLVVKRLLEDKYPPSAWNIYLCHFTDGDNLSSDNQKCVDAIRSLLPNLNLLCYWELDASSGGDPGWYRSTTFGSVLDKELAGVPVVETFRVHDKPDVVRGLRQFFRKRGEPK